MFSALNNILGTTPPRQTEETDTRQALQRHDPDNPNRRKKKPKDEAETVDDGFTTTLSVEALESFLKTLLESKTTNEKPKQTTQRPDGHIIQTEMIQDDNDTPKHVSARAAQAAGAYQSTTINTHKKENVLLETTDTASSGPEFDLSATDIRTIHQLLEDCKQLSSHGIEYIHIERADTFLQSLQNAVADAKLTIN